jgi:hypothetical protein
LLSVLAPLDAVGDETRLRLSAPRATHSQLRLKVPVADAVAETSDGATLLAASASGDGTTELTVAGLGRDFELTWRKPDAPASEVQTVMEAVGSILVKIDSPNVLADARLTVRGYGGDFDRFQVRLPSGATLVPGSASGYSIVPVPGKGPGAGERPLLEVRLPKKTAGPVEVRLATRQSADVANPNGWLDLAGFEVVQAARQWGHVAVVVVRDWQVLWGPLRGVRQVDQLPDALKQEDVVAGFEYFSQPCSLSARVVPRQTRIMVEPLYLLLVEPDLVRLEARLKYTVRGAKVSALDVELPEWQLEETGPDNVVAADAAVVGPNGVLSLPLLQPATGPIEVTLQASRKISRDNRSLVIQLPRPQANAQAPAAVVVLPADNVELIPKTGALAGLARQQEAPSIRLPKRQQEPLFYRGEASKAVFAADFRVHPQSLSVDVSSQISLEQGQPRVEQKLAYTVAYEPAERLALDVPRGLVQNEALEVLLEGRRLALLEPGSQAGAEDASAPARRHVVLPAARIGSLELMIRYPLTLEKLLPKASVLASVPLVMPAEGRLTGNRVSVSGAPGVNVEHRAGPWTRLDGDLGPAAPSPGLQLAAAQPAAELLLALRRDDEEAKQATVIGQAWVQTWLTARSGQERAVFRFTSDQKELELTLPAAADLTGLELLVDREVIRGRATPEGRVAVLLPGDRGRQFHTLEARYPLTTRPGPGRWTADFPRLGRETWIGRMYWQLVLPETEHLVLGPAPLTPESTWGWSGLYWGRKPLLDQARLEAWCGARHLAPVPARTNCYLFSAPGGVESCPVYTANRSLIVLVASGLVLAVGLVLIYVPAARHPAALFTLAVVLAAALVFYPEPALLASQAASLGVVMAAVAGWLYRRGARRRGRGWPREAPSSVIDRGSVRSSLPLPAVAHHQLSTQTAPAPAAGPASDAIP